MEYETKKAPVNGAFFAALSQLFINIYGVLDSGAGADA
jgi:hypothetical protein